MKKLICIFFTLICFSAKADKSINVWSAYTNENFSTNDFEIKGIGLSAKITNNIFIGLSYSETNLDFYYPDTTYTEKVQLDSLRLRFGYLF